MGQHADAGGDPGQGQDGHATGCPVPEVGPEVPSGRRDEDQATAQHPIGSAYNPRRLDTVKMSSPTPNDNYHEGPPMAYVPVRKSPADFMFTFGPLGYRRVEVVEECPISVRRPAGNKPERATR